MSDSEAYSVSNSVAVHNDESLTGSDNDSYIANMATSVMGHFRTFVISDADKDVKGLLFSFFITNFHDKARPNLSVNMIIDLGYYNSSLYYLERNIYVYLAGLRSEFLRSCFDVYVGSFKEYCGKVYNYHFPIQIQMLMTCHLPFSISLSFRKEHLYSTDFAKISYVTQLIIECDTQIREKLLVDIGTNSVGVLFESLLRIRYRRMIFEYLRDRMLRLMQLYRLHGLNVSSDLAINDTVEMKDAENHSSQLRIGGKCSEVFGNGGDQDHPILIDSQFCALSSLFLPYVSKVQYFLDVSEHLESAYLTSLPSKNCEMSTVTAKS